MWIFNNPFAGIVSFRFEVSPHIGIPKVTSSCREDVHFEFVTNGMIPGDMLYFIPADSLYVFGIMMSQFQNAWMQVIPSSFSTSYRYANALVHNTFVFPDVIFEQNERSKRLLGKSLRTVANTATSNFFICISQRLCHQINK